MEVDLACRRAESVFQLPVPDTGRRSCLREEVTVQQRVQGQRRGMAQMLKIQNDIQLGLVRGIGKAGLQLCRVQMVQRALQFHHQRRQLFMFARLDAQELVHLP